MSKSNINELKLNTVERLLRVSNKMLFGRKHPRDYGTGDLLYMSEIEVIREISAKDRIHLTDLSILLGVSKATLSPIINKLEKNNYLLKNPSSTNAKIKLLSITQKGEQVMVGMLKYALKFDQYMDGVTKNDLMIYVDFLSRLEEFIDDVDHGIRN